MTEHTINDALAEVLRTKRQMWRSDKVVSSENTGMLKGTSERPDILVIEPNVSPVVVETEVLPAPTVEADALARLGKHLRHTGRTILSVVAIRLPLRLRTKSGKKLASELENADDLEMALFTGSDSSNFTRYPHAGWVRGTVADVSILVQSASVPPEVIDAAADQLVSGVSEVAGLLGEVAPPGSGAIKKICEELRQEESEQTRRMAATILANAFVFQESLAGGPGELASVRSLDELRGTTGALTKTSVLAEWRKILKVNYWPIFDIARRILEVLPAASSKAIIESLAVTADNLLKNQLMRSHDLTGSVFQRLIADRKFLAAYYTTPASAALLVGLAIAPNKPASGGSWSNSKDVQKLRVADFACGTGTLLSTAYQRIGQLHELAGGDSEALHPEMMAHGLIGCDVLPAAAHLTASMLSGAHPTVKYTQSSIMTVAYGKQPDGGIALGSLDLLDPQRTFGILAITAHAAEGMGEKEKEIWSHLPHASFDMVFMNPPFTRATGHESSKIGVPNPMFAAFSSTVEEQRLMGAATKRLTDGTSAHGNAGEASIFLVLADRKLTKNGTLALVMPLSLMSGEAWEKSRALLVKNYTDLVLVSITGGGSGDMSFSADTGMGECLVVGSKSGTPSDRATFVVLKERPAFPMLGAGVAREVRRLIDTKALRRLEDGPVGGAAIMFGSDVIGHVLDAPISATDGWYLSRVADLSLAQSAFQLRNNGKVWLPGMQKSQALGIPIAAVGAVGKIGPYHSDIEGSTSSGGVRGPFTVSPVTPGAVPTYPVLWSHDAARERTMAFDADSEGIARMGATPAEEDLVAERIPRVAATASHCHFNINFRFNSQSTGMQFTPRRSIGGRAWASIQMASEDHEKALVLWANTSLGLLLHWWQANKQQAGRGNIGKSALEDFVILDVTKLNAKQLSAAVNIFDQMRDKALRPINEMDVDDVRKELDQRFTREVLGVDFALLAKNGAMDLLRMKLAREPSIQG
ncbi:MAG: hypothetical protein HY067_02425 [Betaproteobacteria bacterium]|nr:hypothetical protein [Betaproteobacteria bacterium]